MALPKLLYEKQKVRLEKAAQLKAGTEKTSRREQEEMHDSESCFGPEEV
jgi:hypothetical protein